MKINKIYCCLFIFSIFSSNLLSQSTSAYLNTSYSFEQRADSLLSQLTLEEKVGILRYDSPAIERLGIPAYNWWNECLHGVARSGLATVFPQAIGMAAMWDSKQMFDIANVISDEARAKHHDYVSRGKHDIYQGLTFWTPNINIFRDPRWGRGMETYGEDPYLTSELAIPFIKGLEGDDPKYLKLIATVKHFAVHSGPEYNRHSFDVYPSDYDLAETYLPHFKRTVIDGHVYSVMCAYNRLRGVPCCGDKYLEDLLRNKWGFNGYIVSDCGAISDIYRKDAHNVVNTRSEAAAMALQAGTDLNCGDSYARGLLEAVKNKLITELDIDVSVRRLLLARFKLGMFDPIEMVKYAQIPLSVLDSEQHRLMALQAARKSMVLLKNDANLLPYTKNVKRVAVIGPNANDPEVLLANYNGYPSRSVTPLQGIIEKLPESQISFAQGCALSQGLPYLTLIPGEFFYTDVTLKTQGLNAEYFNNSELNGSPMHTRIDTAVNFVWRDKSPFPNMQQGEYSVRWKGVILPPVSGEYAIGGEAFSGFKLSINNKLIVQRSDQHSSRKSYEFVQLEAGKPYDIELEYYQNNTDYAHMNLYWDVPGEDLKKEALELAANSDLVILCMGLSPLLEGEEMPVKVEGFQAGDRLDIKLPSSQTNLISAIHELGKPTILVLLNGSALAFNYEAENIPAIIEAWYPGQSGGTAIADVIFGDYNPAGRLPITFYKDINQIPDFEDYDMDGKTYRYFKGQPLFEFGYGLSFSTFEYNIKDIPKSISTGDSIKLAVEVTNTGNMDGDEVVQLYVSLPNSKLKKPIRSLQGFKRVHLAKGKSQIVEFKLYPAQFAARNLNNVPIVETGKVLVSIGGKQPDEISIASKKVVEAEVDLNGDVFYIQE